MTQTSPYKTTALAVATVCSIQLVACKGGEAAGPNDAVGRVALIALSLDSTDVHLGDTVRLSAVPRDASGNPVSGVAVVWSSTNTSVATVTSSGLVTAVGIGSADIEVDVAPSTSRASFTLLASYSAAGSPSATRSLAARRSRAKIIVVPPASPCEDIASIRAFIGALHYDYAIEGTTGGGSLVAAEYHGQVTATMTNQGWARGVPSVAWSGSLTGSASQQETLSSTPGKVDSRLEGAGAVLTDVQGAVPSKMSLIVDLTTCTYQLNVSVTINLVRTDFGKASPAQPGITAQLYVGRGKQLGAWRSDGGFPDLVTRFPGHSLIWVGSNPTLDAFMPLGLATLAFVFDSPREPPLGAADVGLTVSVVKQ